ncbi:MAG TPA: YihY/virulence factor BrkB family protein [Devosiaceae bacterium]
MTRTGIEIFGMDTSLRCAGVAFFAFLSLFPALGSVVLLVGLVVDSSFLIQAIERLSDLLPTSILNLIRDQMLALTNQPNEQLGIGLAAAIALALWSGSRGVNALLYAVSRTRHEADKRSFLLGVAVSLVVTVLGAASLVIALTLVAILPAILSLPFVGLGDSLLLLLRWPVLFGLAVLGFTGFYRFAPDRRPRRFRHVLPGAIVAALLWLAACFLFSFYVEHFGNYDATFGSLSVAVVLLLWMYNSALILVLGASLNAEIEKEWHPSQVRA